MPSSSVENYLKHMLLEEQERPAQAVATGQLAGRLELSPGTVSSTLKTLAESGFLIHEPYGGARLTDAGRRLALRVVRRHRLVELFLVEVMGLDWSEVHAEAEDLEHVVSDRLVERMDAMLGYPAVDPHGDPIPSARGELAERPRQSLLRCPEERWLEVVRVTDQQPAFLQLAQRRGLVPGSRLQVLRRDRVADTIEVELAGGERVSLGQRAAAKILVGEPVDG